MRIIGLIREALLTWLGTAGAVMALFVSVRELTRLPGVQNATLNGMVPITVSKLPWVVLILVVLVLLVLRARAIGAQRGMLWGIRTWLLRAGFWWSVLALLLFVGVLIYGILTQHLADLRWPFSIGFLVVTLIALVGFHAARVRFGHTAPRADASADEAR